MNVTRRARHPFINKIVKTLIVSDLLMFGGFGLFSPIFAVFITDQIAGGNIQVAGFAATIYLGLRAVLQVPFARLVDRMNERSVYWWMITGSLVITFVVFLYMFVNNLVQLYSVQVLLGLGAAVNYPTWRKLFYHHLDVKREVFEWSLWDTTVAVSYALAAAIGGSIAKIYGFENLFFIGGIVSLIGTSVLVVIFYDVTKAKDKKESKQT